MSSGEVLYIVAFIVLPTAILVSSVWAVVFVRSRPDPRTRYQADEAGDHQVEQDPAGQPTAVLPTIETPAHQPLAAQPEAQPVEPVEEQELEVIRAAEEPAPHVVQDDDEPVDSEVEEPQPAVAALDTQVPQTTEDLGEVVSALNKSDDVEESEQVPASELELEPETELVADVDPPHDAERFETRELPVVEQQPADAPPPVEEDLGDARTSRQRRRQSAKLLPTDSDVPRQRGRNRDSQRQVPQLNRSFRRRDETQTGPPSEPDSEADSPDTRG